MEKGKVIVGLSGGVDSSVAANLLKQEGYQVEALFMINWHETEGTLSGDCPWEDDLLIARLVARRLEIPLEVVDLSGAYRERVVNYMFAEYERGRTPNPDVLCNREIKFAEFMDAALARGADYVATGHYCRKETIAGPDGRPVYRLLAGADPAKDQSYFLCQLSQGQLAKALFPVGHLLKPRVRAIAEGLGLATATRKDSQGICFVGKVDLPTFLQQQLRPKTGPIVELLADAAAFAPRGASLEEQAADFRFAPGMGRVVGTHPGAHFFTIGQRKGLNVGGKPKPLFVVGIDTAANVVYVGQGQDHPGLFRPALRVEPGQEHWLRPERRPEAGQSARFLCRIRYRQALQAATLHVRGQGLFIAFDEPQRGITPGQFAAWYDGEELIGSGTIA